MGSWTEKVNQWLIVLDDLTETWGLAPRALMAAHNDLLRPVPGNLLPSLGLCGYYISRCTGYTHQQNIQTHKIKINTYLKMWVKKSFYDKY